MRSCGSWPGMRWATLSLVAMLWATVCARAQQPDGAPPAQPFAKPWHIAFPRPVMLAAWERVRNVPVPGVDLDQRFKIDGPVFYVSPNGDDAADGSKDHPWKTLQFAAGNLKPGAVINVMAGTYYGPVEIKTRADERSPAALRAMPGQDVVVVYPDAFTQQQRSRIASIGKEGALDQDGKSLHYPSLITVSGTFVEISGLHLIGARDHLPMNLYSESGISLADRGGNGCRILYNEIENTGHCGVKEMGHGGRSFLIEGNCIHDIGHTFHDHAIYMPADDVTIRKNILINAAGWGVHAYTAPKRLTISHNIIGGNAQDAVILGGTDCRVFNNVFYKDNAGGVFFFRAGCRNNLVVNNIIIEPAPFRFDSMGSAAPADQPRDNTIDHNCISAPRSVTLPPAAGAHNIQGDPRCVDAAKLDFGLQEGSPCVGGGDGSVVPKVSGRPVDVGLYESR